MITVYINGKGIVRGRTPESIARTHFGRKMTLRVISDNESIVRWNVLEPLPNKGNGYSAIVRGYMCMYK